MNGRVTEKAAEVKEICSEEVSRLVSDLLNLRHLLGFQYEYISGKGVAPSEKSSRFHLPPVSHLTCFEEEIDD